MPGKPENGWFKPWDSVQNAVLLFAFCFVVALFDLNKSELASWVQAIGSIASIWAAFLIGNKQISKQNQIREQEANSRTAAFYFVVKNAAKNAMAFGQLVEEESRSSIIRENWEGIYFNLLTNYKNSISQLPSYQLGNHELVESFHGIAGCIDSIIAIVESTMNRNAFQEPEFAFMRQQVNTQHRICIISWQRFEEASKALNLSITLS